MTIYICSDWHLSHANILKFNPETRPYDDAEQMNAAIIKKCQETVNPDDLIYFLGDIAFCNPTLATEMLQQISCRKILIKGNHDAKLVEYAPFRACFESIHDYLEIKHNGTHVVMCHYPMAYWNRSDHGSVMLFGHLHGSISGLEPYRARDVGVDATGNILNTLDDIVADSLLGEIKKRNGRECN